MILRCATLLAAVLAVLAAATPEEEARLQLLRHMPDLSWARLTEIERLVERNDGLSIEELLKRSGNIELYQPLPEVSDQQDLTGPITELLLGPYITPLGAKRAISPLCRRHSRKYVNNIISINNTWALKMFDSIGKLPDGILAGNTNPVGIWDECLSVNAVIDGIHTEENMFKGKYCRPQFSSLPDATDKAQQSTAGLQSGRRPSGLGLEPILPPIIHVSGQTVLSGLTYSVGLCIPSSCTADELRQGLQKTMPGVAVSLSDSDCYVKDQETSFSAGDIVVMTILCVVGFLMAVGTFIDVVKENAMEDDANISIAVDSKIRGRLPMTLQKVLLAFSVWTNGRKLLDTSSSSDTLGCLHGMRFISMTWVLLGHQYVFGLGVPWANAFYIFDIFNSLAFAAIDNATVSVDSFFFLSGLLLAYIFMRNMERSNGKFNIIMYYVHRYIRLTPVLAMVIAFVSTLYVHLGDGPFWGQSAEQGTPEVCRNYWWRNLLYINNLFDTQTLCMGQTWYLANDMQMFIASPIVLLPLFFYPVLGQIWLILLVALNMFITGYVTVYNDLGPLDNTPGSTTLRYFMPYCRYGAYLVGVYTGWFLHQRRRRRVKLSLPAVLAGWLSAALVACLIVYGLYEYNTVPVSVQPSRSVSVIYAALSRPVWAMCLAWVVIACVHGYGGFINSLLSWRLWIPLSRLTYCCYLVSIDTQIFFYASLKSVLYFDQTNAVYQFLSTLCIVVAVATAFSLAFESPMLALEKIIFANVGATTSKKKTEPEPVMSAEPKQEEELAEVTGNGED